MIYIVGLLRPLGDERGATPKTIFILLEGGRYQKGNGVLRTAILGRSRFYFCLRGIDLVFDFVFGKGMWVPVMVCTTPLVRAARRSTGASSRFSTKPSRHPTGLNVFRLYLKKVAASQQPIRDSHSLITTRTLTHTHIRFTVVLSSGDGTTGKAGLGWGRTNR